MESALLGIVLDSSLLIAAERRKLRPEQTIENVQKTVGEIPIVLCSVTVAESGHGIYRADTQETRSRRRKFLDELKATVPIYPVTEVTAEIVARVGGEQAAKGINLPLGDLMIGACALELGYAIGTGNVRDFSRIRGTHNPDEGGDQYGGGSLPVEQKHGSPVSAFSGSRNTQTTNSITVEYTPGNFGGGPDSPVLYPHR